jgi:hypothetical protein
MRDGAGLLHRQRGCFPIRLVWNFSATQGRRHYKINRLHYGNPMIAVNKFATWYKRYKAVMLDTKIRANKTL